MNSNDSKLSAEEAENRRRIIEYLAQALCDVASNPKSFAVGVVSISISEHDSDLSVVQLFSSVPDDEEALAMFSSALRVAYAQKYEGSPSPFDPIPKRQLN